MVDVYTSNYSQGFFLASIQLVMRIQSESKFEKAFHQASLIIRLHSDHFQSPEVEANLLPLMEKLIEIGSIRESELQMSDPLMCFNLINDYFELSRASSIERIIGGLVKRHPL